MRVSREVKTGILVITGIVLFIIGFNYLKGKNLLEPKDRYYTTFDYNSLTTASPVTINGNPVGKIYDIKYDFNSGKTIVSFSIDPRLQITNNTVVKMYEPGLMGGNALAIIMNPGELVKPGYMLKSEIEIGMITNLSSNLSNITADLNSTLKSTDSLMKNLNSLVKDESNKGLKHTIVQLNGTLKSIEGTSNGLNSIVAKNNNNITGMIENFSEVSTNLSQLTSALKSGQSVDKLNQTIAQLSSILTTIESGKGTLGKLTKDEGLYTNIDAATKQLKELLEDIKLHPKRYFRILSKKEIPYKKPLDTITK